ECAAVFGRAGGGVLHGGGGFGYPEGQMAPNEQPRELRLVREAEQAVRQGRTAAALELLRQAEAIAPDDLSVHLYKSLAHRASGDFPAALAAIERALVVDPYSFLARL